MTEQDPQSPQDPLDLVTDALSAYRLPEGALEAVATLVDHQRREYARRENQPGQVPRQEDPNAKLRDILRAKQEFGKAVQRNPFIVGERPWKMFFRSFTDTMQDYDHLLTDEFLKRTLYNTLSGEAQRIAGERMHPTQEENAQLGLNEYAQRLQELFEPKSESENAKAEFRQRKQMPGESPTLFFADKMLLFYRGWSKEQRDMQMFYDETTMGLQNELVKEAMYTYEPKDVVDYEKRLNYVISSVRKRYINKMISQAQALGTETYTPSGSYRAVNVPGGISIKREPNGHVHAINAAETRTCWMCGKQGHLSAQCPRRNNGLAPAAAAVVEDEPEGLTPEDEGINYVQRGRGFAPYQKTGQVGGNKNFRQNNNNRFRGKASRGRPLFQNKGRGGYNQQVATVYEDDDGNLFLDGVNQVEEEEEPKETEDENKEDGVNVVYDGTFDEADLLQNGFLGI